ncbi:TauD/TfdA family dioxygenase [Nonomuraea ceibae]|uniref:TauD/TfdA family dioxygenase n=1 Tax=Nonomuraea ceibae TaxID=1935170 RepID=UPI001C5F1FB9|nr:TauD/TfdA family dioxygenase [Nonomuraea ceibae]
MTSLPATWPATWPAAQQPNQAPFGLHLNISGGTLSDLSPATVLDLVAENHLLILRGLPATLPCEEFEAFGCALGEPILWSDRPAFSVQAQAEPEDFLFETGFMPMHWDGIFSDDHTPDLQIFHCVQAVDPALGGATLFCDTTRVLADAAPHTRALWESLTLHHERFINGRTLTRDLPLVSRHPHRGHAVLRYHEPVPADISILNPPLTTLSQAPGIRHRPDHGRPARGGVPPPPHLHPPLAGRRHRHLRQPDHAAHPPALPGRHTPPTSPHHHPQRRTRNLNSGSRRTGIGR